MELHVIVVTINGRIDCVEVWDNVDSANERREKFEEIIDEERDSVDMFYTYKNFKEFDFGE